MQLHPVQARAMLKVQCYLIRLIMEEGPQEYMS